MRRLLALAAWMLLAAPAYGQQQAWVVTDQARPQQCLSAVVVKEIDGREVRVSHRAFELAPGRHRLNGMARIDTTHCPVTDAGPGPPVRDLAAEFEAGKTYFVGLDHAPANRGEWQLVIWRIERDGVQLFPPADRPGSAGQP